jgi:hypothetical protein
MELLFGYKTAFGRRFAMANGTKKTKTKAKATTKAQRTLRNMIGEPSVRGYLH